MRLVLSLSLLLAFAAAGALAAKCSVVRASQLANPADRTRFKGHWCTVCGTAPVCVGGCGWPEVRVDTCGEKSTCPDGSTCMLGRKHVCCISRESYYLIAGKTHHADRIFNVMVLG